MANFHWQNGYGAFSISKSHLQDLREYIINQETRHKSVGFKDEFLELLKQHNITYDERYLWD